MPELISNFQRRVQPPVCQEFRSLDEPWHAWFREMARSFLSGLSLLPRGATAEVLRGRIFLAGISAPFAPYSPPGRALRDRWPQGPLALRSNPPFVEAALFGRCLLICCARRELGLAVHELRDLRRPEVPGPYVRFLEALEGLSLDIPEPSYHAMARAFERGHDFALFVDSEDESSDT